MNILRNGVVFLALGAFAACGSSTTSTTTTDDASSTGDTTLDDATDVVSGTDATTDTKDVKDVATKDIPAPNCATRVGAYSIDGTCTGGATSITYGCMLAKDCELTWIGDYRAWSGPLKGNDFTLASTDGSETFTGSFDSASTGFYHYDNGSLTCDATVVQLDPTQADSLCCDVLTNDCKSGDACIVVPQAVNNTSVLTTGCVPLATSPTAEGGPCTQSATETGCAVGSDCIRNTGSTGNDGTCQRLCHQGSDCKSGQQCDIVADAPRAGICDTSCAPFADEGGGEACPSGQNCLPTLVSGDKYARSISTVCGTAGTATAGLKCGNGVYCGIGLVCVQAACTPLCDTKHPCATGKCTSYGMTNAAGTPAGFGYCK